MKSVILVEFQPVMRQLHTEDTADEHLRGGYKSGHRCEPFRLRSSVLSLRARGHSTPFETASNISGVLAGVKELLNKS
jgi:hypothetical protein